MGSSAALPGSAGWDLTSRGVLHTLHPVRSAKSRLLTPGEAADLLGVHPATLTRWAAAGRISFVQLTPTSPRRYVLAELLAMLETQRREQVQ